MMPRSVRVALLVVAALAAGGARSEAAPSRPRLAVVFDPSAASLPRAEIRTAIAAELNAVLVEDPGAADGVLSVARDDQGRLVVTYRPLQTTVVRSVPEPADSTDTPALLALVAGNLVRNEALELMAPVRWPVGPADLTPPAPAPAIDTLVPPFPTDDGPSDLVSPFPAADAPAPPRATPSPSAAAPAPATGVRQGAGSDQTSWVRRLYVMASVGSGMGYSRGTPEMNPTFLEGTRASSTRVEGAHRVAGYHVAPEVAFLWRPNLIVGGQLRLQHVLGATEVHHPSCGSDGICNPPSTAVALLGRLGSLHPLGDRLRLQVSGALGLGRVRHLVSLSDLPISSDCGSDGASACKDTLASGLLLFGPGVSVHYQLGTRAWVFGGVQGLISAPRTMLNVDATAGLALRL